MKKWTFLFLASLLFLSCKKEIDLHDTLPPHLQQLSLLMQQQLSSDDFQILQWQQASINRVDSLDIIITRIPLENKPSRNHFLLLVSNNSLTKLEGHFVYLTDNETATQNLSPNYYQPFNGAITLTGFDGSQSQSWRIEDGYIQRPSPGTNMRTLSMESPYQTLPEVIVIATYPNDNISWSTWVNLLSLYETFDGGNHNFYSNLDGGGGGGGGSGSDGSYGDTGGDSDIEPLVEVDEELQDINPAIDIKKFLQCFAAIPDAGATCSIEILSDIPIDSDPSAFMNWQTGSPGHVFIKLNKKNNGQSVQQSLGWYPVKGYKVLLTTAPIEGKFVNNAHHEFNISLQMDLSPSQLQAAINEILYLESNIRYDIDDYNCTDFALQIFNRAMSPADRLEIPRYDIPGGSAANGSHTPQGVFMKLRSLKNSGSHLASKINMPGIKGWVGSSTGPCN